MTMITLIFNGIQYFQSDGEPGHACKLLLVIFSNGKS